MESLRCGRFEITDLIPLKIGRLSLWADRGTGLNCSHFVWTMS